MNQQIRFCKVFGGTRRAYAMTGESLPLVAEPHWRNHLEYEWQSTMRKPWIEPRARAHRLLRIDMREWASRLRCSTPISAREF